MVEAVYFTQYSLNFLVYAFSNKQYREAYLLFLRDACRCIARKPISPSMQQQQQQPPQQEFELQVVERPASFHTVQMEPMSRQRRASN